MHLCALPTTDDQHRSAVAVSVLGRGICDPRGVLAGMAGAS